MRISTLDGLLELLDEHVSRSDRGDVSTPAADSWWREMLTRPGHPLNTALPDEPLVDWHDRGLLPHLEGARVLDIGCGNGRNSAWFARQGAHVLGVDIAASLLDHVRGSMPDGVTLQTLDILRDDPPHGPFDVVYDSGCFHHVAPHRRVTYLEHVMPRVAPGGVFGIVTLSGEAMPGATDLDVLTTGDTGGGIPFALDELDSIFTSVPLTCLELRPVQPGRADTFAVDFLNCGLFHRDATPSA